MCGNWTVEGWTTLGGGMMDRWRDRRRWTARHKVRVCPFEAAVRKTEKVQAETRAATP